jgi:hypothetical protein
MPYKVIKPIVDDYFDFLKPPQPKKISPPIFLKTPPLFQTAF